MSKGQAVSRRGRCFVFPSLLLLTDAAAGKVVPSVRTRPGPGPRRIGVGATPALAALLPNRRPGPWRGAWADKAAIFVFGRLRRRVGIAAAAPTAVFAIARGLGW